MRAYVVFILSDAALFGVFSHLASSTYVLYRGRQVEPVPVFGRRGDLESPGF